MKNVSAEDKITDPKKWGEAEFKQYIDLFKEITQPSGSRLTSSSVNPIPLLEAILVYACGHAGSDTVKSFLRDEPSLRKPELIGVYPPYCQQLIDKLKKGSLTKFLIQRNTFKLLISLLMLTDTSSPESEKTVEFGLLIIGDIKSDSDILDAEMNYILHDYFLQSYRKYSSVRIDLFFLYFIVYSSRRHPLFFCFNESEEIIMGGLIKGNCFITSSPPISTLKEIANYIENSQDFFSLCNFSKLNKMISRKRQVINFPNLYNLNSTYELNPGYITFLDLLHEFYNPFAPLIAPLIDEEEKINGLFEQYTFLPFDIINLIVEGYYTSGVKKFSEDNHLEVKQPTEHKFATLYKFSPQIHGVVQNQNYVDQLMKFIKDPRDWDEGDFARHRLVFERTPFSDIKNIKKILLKSILVYGCSYAQGATVLAILEFYQKNICRLELSQHLCFCQILIDNISTPIEDQTKKYKRQLLFSFLGEIGFDSRILLTAEILKFPEILKLWLLILGDNGSHVIEDHPRTIWVNDQIRKSVELIPYFDDPKTKTKTHPGEWLKNLFLIFIVYADRYPAHFFIIDGDTDNSIYIYCDTTEMPLKSITKIIAGLSEGISLSDFTELPVLISREHKEIYYPNDCKLKSTYRLSDNCLTFLNLLRKQNPFGSVKDRLIKEEQKIGDSVEQGAKTSPVITSLIMEYHSGAKKFFEEADQSKEKQLTSIYH